MDLDGGLTPCHGVGILSVYMALCKLCGPSEIFSDSRGVVQALNKGEVGIKTRISGFWSGARKVSSSVKAFNIRVVMVVWTKAQNTLEEKAKMSPEDRWPGPMRQLTS